MNSAAPTATDQASSSSAAMLAGGLMIVILIMVLPVPSLVLDLGLTISFALAVLIFTTTLFIERPLDFSAFPTILLGSLILRLSLNVSSTKLIIGEGHTGVDAAGNVIRGFAMFVMGGNFFLGLVVFGVLMIVNFFVITKGAGRMAEVGARFALDAMPGKQLAIDSDVAAGAISHEEAKERRRIEQEETTFFGSLDGASKFVKGDAVAGLLITLLNLVAGVTIGIGGYGLSVSDAFSAYAILTVGDGLVSQIPAVIVSVATALLLSKGGVAGTADKAVFAQLGAQPIALTTVGTILTAFALLPGLPLAPFLVCACLFYGAALFVRRRRKSTLNAEPIADVPAKAPASLGDALDIDEVHVEFSSNLVPLVMDVDIGLDARIGKLRRYFANDYGFITPPVRLSDNLDLDDGHYRIRIQGVIKGRGFVDATSILVITDRPNDLPFEGRDVQEPVYNAPARWIAPANRDDALALGLSPVEPPEIIATHLLETIKQNFAQLLTRQATKRIFDEFKRVSDPEKAAANKIIIDEFIPDKAPIEYVQAIFKLLLSELIPIKNLPLLLEAAADAHAYARAPEIAYESVRQRIAPGFIARMLGNDGTLPLIQLDGRWEELFSEHEIVKETGVVDVALSPELFNTLAQSISAQLSAAAERKVSPVIVTSTKRRRFLRTVLDAKRIEAPVISYEEIDPRQRLLLVGKA